MAIIETTIELGKVIREARKQLHLTQPQLALASGVGVRFIVELEGGKSSVRTGHVLRVLNTLGGELRIQFPYVKKDSNRK